MLKKIIVILLALLLPCTALAETYMGVSCAQRETAVLSETGGQLRAFDVRVGDVVTQGQTLGSFGVTNVFATQDGEIVQLLAQVGDDVSETVLEIAPVELYTIYCSQSKAKDETTLLHAGETLYIKCTKNGTHRAVGVVTEISNDEYLVLTIGGELFVGETVYLYRDSEFDGDSRVGIGTVVLTDTETYAANGRIAGIYVEEGEEVERGELLYSYIETGDTAFTAPVSGIVSSVSVQKGTNVRENDVLLQIVEPEDIRVKITADEKQAAQFARGQCVKLTPAYCEEEEYFFGSVSEVHALAQDGMFEIFIMPDEPMGYLGLSVKVDTEIDAE